MALFWILICPALPLTVRLTPMLILILPPGGFFVFGILIALSQKLSARLDKNPAANADNVCAGAVSDEAACLLCGACSLGAEFRKRVDKEIEPITDNAPLAGAGKNETGRDHAENQNGGQKGQGGDSV